MILFILGACLLAKIRGYRVWAALKDWSLFPIWAAELLFVIAQIFAWSGNYVLIPWAAVFQRIYLLLLLFPTFRFHLYKEALAGSGLVFIGSALNRWVMNANGGKMPVYPTLSRLTRYYRDGALEAAGDELHMLMTESTKLNFLGDWMDVGFSIMSIGDLFIHGFLLLILYRAIVMWNRGKRNDGLHTG